jgi:phage N-6-adenine-methyltransferase
MDWETPRQLFRKLNNEFSFDVDVCANSQNRKCDKYFDVDDDGLKQIWSGVCWMNPPYGREIKHWVEKAHQETVVHGNADMVVCLVPVRSDTKWWHDFIMNAKEIRFLNKRLSFEGSNNKAPFSACIVVFCKQNLKPVRVLVEDISCLREAKKEE